VQRAQIERAAPVRVERELFGHPIGLFYFVLMEAFERFSYYGMQSLLVLYMTGYLLKAGTVEHVAGFGAFRAALEAVFGPLSTIALAAQIFGLYTGLVYLVPVLGGLAGDRWLGRRRAIVLGASVMALGHFLMASDRAFLAALATLIAGSGLLKGNVSAQLGSLYDRNDARRDRGFTIYYTAVNVGTVIAPLACGTLGEVYGWHYGFALAGVFMLAGLGVYLSALPYLPPDAPRTAAESGARMGAKEWKIVAALAVVLLAAAAFWTAQSQIWNTYPLWARDRVARDAFGYIVPVTWFQSVDALSAFVVAPPVLWLWTRQAKRGTEPGDLIKIAIGCLIFAGSVLWLSAGELLAGSGKVPILWAFAFHFLSAGGYIYSVPTAVALFSRTAPQRINAMMIAIYYLSIFLGSTASGWLGRFYEVLSGFQFWTLHAAICAGGATLVLVLKRPLSRALDAA
jgi:POT family proton-dependent oligopeptide transporter